MTKKIVKFKPVHPGELLVEYLEHYGWSTRKLARVAHIPLATIEGICYGKSPVTLGTALRLGRAFRERDVMFWSRLQTLYDRDSAAIRKR